MKKTIDATNNPKEHDAISDDSMRPQGLVDVPVNEPSELVDTPVDRSPELEDVESPVIHDQLPSVEEMKMTVAAYKNHQWLSTSNKWLLIKSSIFISSFAAIFGLIALFLSEGYMSGSGGRRGTRIVEVVDFLSGFSDYDALTTPGTPQSLAAAWIADIDKRNVSMDHRPKFLQRYALAVFYFSFGGPSYWPRPLRFLSEDDECMWFEVGFDEVDTALEVGASCKGSEYIKQLVFAPQYLRGTFPAELELLPHLEHISIFRNPGVTGKFPTALRELPKLKYLSLNYCTFDSRLPDWIGDLTSLTSLMLSNNRFVGRAPESLGKLTNLKNLLLDDNSFIGNVNMFKKLTNLEVLIAEDNFFHGQLDETFFTRLKNLKVLDVSNNQIESKLPANLFSAENMMILDLHGNKFHGTIPDVGKKGWSKKLELLALNDNSLIGSIPTTLGKLKELDHLDLADNKLTSEIPTSLESLSNLKYLFLAKNNFTAGLIPGFIQNLSNLRDLSLRATNRKGKVPHWMSLMSSLVLLDLHQNKLKGTIPNAMSKLHGLKYLLLNDNELTGQIPDNFGSLQNLSLLLLEKNNLIGTSDVICRNDHQPDLFITDCAGRTPEIECECCTECCHDGNNSCNDAVALGDIDPVWEKGFVRNFYNLGRVTLANP